jgi:serine/threonine protein kinase
MSASLRSLVVGLLHPDPHQRMSIEAALRHEWVNASPCEIDPVVQSILKKLELTHLHHQLGPTAKQLGQGERGGGLGGGEGSPVRTWN